MKGMTKEERKHLTRIGRLSLSAFALLTIGLELMQKDSSVGSFCIVLSGIFMLFIYGSCWIPLWIEETSK